MIRIHYKCSCMQDEGSLEMPERTPAENVMDFMDRLQLEVGLDHRRRNPGCQSEKTQYVKIPFQGKRVGDTQ